MNKIININLGNMPFTIDDNAYKTLNSYFSKLKRIGLDDETIEDIETRIAEMFSNNLKQQNRNIITITDVNTSIQTMGRPEDFQQYSNSNTITTSSGHYHNATQHKKKLMRDGNDKILGGVVSGIMKYFGYESATFGRIILFLLPFLDLWFLGISTTLVFLTYIAFWIILPKAVTPYEQQQMRGTPIDVEGLEQKVKEEFNNLERKF